MLNYRSWSPGWWCRGYFNCSSYFVGDFLQKKNQNKTFKRDWWYKFLWISSVLVMKLSEEWFHLLFFNLTERGNYSCSEESSSAKISLKQVHLATDNLSPTNFIGQGIAGNKTVTFHGCEMLNISVICVKMHQELHSQFDLSKFGHDEELLSHNLIHKHECCNE